MTKNDQEGENVYLPYETRFNKIKIKTKQNQWQKIIRRVKMSTCHMRRRGSSAPLQRRKTSQGFTTSGWFFDTDQYHYHHQSHYHINHGSIFRNLQKKRLPLMVRLAHGSSPVGLKSAQPFLPELRSLMGMMMMTMMMTWMMTWMMMMIAMAMIMNKI